MEHRPPASGRPSGDAGEGATPRRRKKEVLLTLWPDRTPDPDAPLDRLRPTSVRRRIAPPRRIGSFRILRPLGSGGMSVVYEAYDERLDRTVALKLLRDKGGRRRQARLQREAQALARLCHPNVVEIYEAGMHEGRAYLVMERLPGAPLHRWLAAAPRTVPEIIETFVQAGQGLAAAHAQGLVHRDFKPSNVLVDDDGRVRVFDFGLAAPTGSPSEDSMRTGPHPIASGAQATGTGPHRAASGSHPALANVELQSHEDVWEGVLTRTGAMLGTPAYMSPEQYEGRPASAQSDQFSFCVALWESLYGEHPFVERQQWELLPKHVMEGRLREPPAGNEVPSTLHRVVMRGLSVQPDGRWPSMQALLVALSQALVQRRHVAWFGASVGVVGVATAMTLWLAHEPEGKERCTGGRDKLAEVWDAAHEDRVRQAMLGTGVPYAEDTFRKVEAGLDDYGAQWLEGHHRACEALLAAAAAGGDDEAMDDRMACLERRRRELGSLVEVLMAADAGVVQQATLAVSQLEEIGKCDAREGVSALAPPSDPMLAERIEVHRGTLSRAKALQRSGRYQEGLAVAESVATAADALGYAPLQVEAHLQVGALHRYLGAHEPAERSLERAYFLATELPYDELARQASTMLAYVVASLQGRPEDGEKWLEHARAAAERVGSARARADYLGTQGSVLLAARRPEEALARFEEALPLLEHEWGPRHPEVAADLNNIGLTLLELDRPEAALEAIQRSLAIREAALGPEHPEVGKMLNNQGLVLMRAGRDEEALLSFQRAHTLRRRVLGPDHPDVAKPLANLATLRLQRGEPGLALPLAAEALAIRERSQGPESPEAAHMHLLLGEVHLAQQHHDQAVTSLTRAVLVFESARGAEHVALVEPLLALAEAERQQGQLDAAHRHVERALSLSQTQEAEPWVLASARFALARVRWDRGEHGPARVEAEAAQRIYAGLAEGRRRRVATAIADVETWLAEHGGP
ncbi:serine/threonine-protein kinase [Paraliomyxa miuraensis]|uniref:serine/threonine-protein kinase n=1 Tax=Paraliomyxa miuraensis TaxID=376150 RepID=UPI00225058A1|nr:serine/threonine-protein kinase [Paraliomyxa miuraensis]MCX4239783.1 serine/threonine-protein kinase [Paraliomyxa miuraensis]